FDDLGAVGVPVLEDVPVVEAVHPRFEFVLVFVELSGDGEVLLLGFLELGEMAALGVEAQDPIKMFVDNVEHKVFYSSTLRTATKASWGLSTFPTIFIRFFPSFCFSRSLRFRETSPP